MNRRNSGAFFAAILFFISYGLGSFIHISPVWGGGAGNPDCDINKGPCLKKAGTSEILLDINPKPVKTMQELTFTVTIKGSTGYDKLIVTLDMPGMYMGENKVIVRKSGDATYTGKGVIPRCLSGKRLWQATVDTPKGEKAEFLFNVIY